MAVVSPVADHERVSGMGIGQRSAIGRKGCEGMQSGCSAENEALAEKAATALRVIVSAHVMNYFIGCLEEPEAGCECIVKRLSGQTDRCFGAECSVY